MARILNTRLQILTKNEMMSKTNENSPYSKVEVVFLISLLLAN